jgi:gentisate 1,2-dioxygenase
MSVNARSFAEAASMEELYALLARCGVQNGWNKPEPSLWPLPRKDFAPARWTWEIGRAALDAAGRFVNTELAERRNLILANPVPGNTYPTVRTLVAAWQMVKAGEVARSHRHTANALRLVLDTQDGAYTIVDGKKIPMEPGDVLLTPNWSWHGHANEGRADAYWMDFLDVPTVHLLGPMFFEHHPDAVERADEVDAASPCRFAWADTQARLAQAQEISPGRREIELGAPALATIALHVTRLDAGASFAEEPSTLSAIYAIMQGGGQAVIDGESFDYARGDALAAPSARPLAFHAREDSWLLRVSDKPLLERLDWLRAIPPQARA